MRTEAVPVTPLRKARTPVLVQLPLLNLDCSPFCAHSVPWDTPLSSHNLTETFSHQMYAVEELFLQLSYPICLDLKGTETKKPCLEECYAKLQAPCSGRFSAIKGSELGGALVGLQVTVICQMR